MDFVAKRYGVLPSELLARGTHLDMMVSELAVNYESWALENPGVKKDHGYTQQQLLDQIERVRNEGRKKPRSKTQTN